MPTQAEWKPKKCPAVSEQKKTNGGIEKSSESMVKAALLWLIPALKRGSGGNTSGEMLNWIAVMGNSASKANKKKKRKHFPIWLAVRAGSA